MCSQQQHQVARRCKSARLASIKQDRAEEEKDIRRGDLKSNGKLKVAAGLSTENLAYVFDLCNRWMREDTTQKKIPAAQSMQDAAGKAAALSRPLCCRMEPDLRETLESRYPFSWSWVDSDSRLLRKTDANERYSTSYASMNQFEVIPYASIQTDRESAK